MSKKIARGLLAVAAAGVALTALIAIGWIAGVVGRNRLLVLAVAGVAVVAAVVLLVVVRVASKITGRGRTVLEWDLSELPDESAPTDPLAALTGRAAMTVADVVRALERAATDKSVAGLVATIGFGAARPAVVQELADAVAAFRATGKYTVAFADDFGGNWGCYLAAGFDRVYLQPGGEVATIGFGGEPNFYGRALAKAGLSMVVDKRHEYKDAMDQLAEGSMAAPPRAALQSLLDGLLDQLVTGIAAGRGLEPGQVRAAIDNAPLQAEEAVEAGLVDQIGYRDEAIDAAKARARGKAKLLYLDRYAKRGGKGTGPTIALVTATGTMVSARSPIGGRSPMLASKVAADLRKAAADDKVKAIVLRVDTPGGEVVASETIHREIVRAREAGTPVVLSMAGVAASGGYWIASAADRVVAQPGTITGSIGVVGAKPTGAALKKRLAIKPEAVSAGKHATMRSFNRPYSRSEQARIDVGLDAVYDRFLDHVAEGRKLSREEAHEVAKGRVWLGNEALELGLVDELGGLPVATRVAKELAGIAPDKKVRLKPYPGKASALAAIRTKKGRSSEDLEAALAAVRSVMAAVESSGLVARGGLHCGLDERWWVQR